MYIYKNECVKDIEKDYLDTLAKCQEITIEDCNKYPGRKRLIGKVLRLISPLM